MAAIVFLFTATSTKQDPAHGWDISEISKHFVDAKDWS